MRRLTKELYRYSPTDLRLLKSEIEHVQSTRLVAGRRPDRKYVGAIDGIVEFHGWHLTDAVSAITFSLPRPLRPKKSAKPKAGKPPRPRKVRPASKPVPPVLLALEADRLKFVVRKDGSTFWTVAPADRTCLEPAAFEIGYAHLVHAAQQWFHAGYRDIAMAFRLSRADQLLEITPISAQSRQAPPIRLTPSVVEPDWTEPWAVQPGSTGVVFDPENLAKTLSVLLEATAISDKFLTRAAEAGNAPIREQDFAGILVANGRASVAFGEALVVAESKGFEGLTFSIGRQDARSLVQALRLMVIGRRKLVAAKKGLTWHPPTWAKDGSINCVRNGDVGFAFPDAEGLRAPSFDDFTAVATAALDISSSGLERNLPALGIIAHDLDDGVTIIALDDRYGLEAAKNPRGWGLHRVDFRQIRDAASPVESLAGSGLKFRQAHLSNILGAFKGGQVKAEIVEDSQMRCLKLSGAVGAVSFSAWIVPMPATVPKAINPKQVGRGKARTRRLAAGSDH